MNHNLIIYTAFSLCSFILTQSCKEKIKNISNSTSELKLQPSIENSEPKKVFNLNISTKPSLSGWTALSDLKTIMAEISDGNYTILEGPEKNLISLFSSLEKEIPETLNINDILVRFKVLETLARKLRFDFNTDQKIKYEFERTKLELFRAYSNLFFQINKTLEKNAQQIFKPI
jgi:hypothetical protein